MERQRIVPDTNILVSALILNRGNPREIFNKFINEEIIFVLSQELLAELEEVIYRPKFDKIKKEEKVEFAALIKELSDIVNPKEKLTIILEDKDDNKVLEAAIEGRANYIVSGDEHLLKLKEFRGIKIVNAQEFLKTIKND